MHRVPAVYDALSGRIAGDSASRPSASAAFWSPRAVWGGPDVGQLTMSEMVEHVRAVTGAVSMPVLADGDTGYGNPLNVRRTVQTYEGGGQAIVIEDQEWPKKCDHIPGSRRVIPTDAYRKKLEAAREARRDPRTVVIARTDAPGLLGFDEALRRAEVYVRTGADGIFLEALRSEAEFRAAPRALPGVPLIAHMFTGGKSPPFTATELAEMGYRVALWVVDALWAAARAVQDVLATLRRDGTTAAVRDRLLPFDEYFALVGLPENEALDRRYADGGDPPRS